MPTQHGARRIEHTDVVEADHVQQIGKAARAEEVHPGIGAHQQAGPERHDDQRDQQQPVSRARRLTAPDSRRRDRRPAGRAARRPAQASAYCRRRSARAGRLSELLEGEGRLIAAFGRALARRRRPAWRRTAAPGRRSSQSRRAGAASAAVTQDLRLCRAWLPAPVRRVRPT